MFSDALEHELRTVKHNLAHKNQEFMSAADGLEYELAGLKDQLEAMESEKQDVLKDKENLLEEVIIVAVIFVSFFCHI